MAEPLWAPTCPWGGRGRGQWGLVGEPPGPRSRPVLGWAAASHRPPTAWDVAPCLPRCHFCNLKQEELKQQRQPRGSPRGPGEHSHWSPRGFSSGREVADKAIPHSWHLPCRHPGWAVTPGACLQRRRAARCILQPPVPPPPRPAKALLPNPSPPSGSTKEVAPIPTPPQSLDLCLPATLTTTTTHHPALTWGNHPRGQRPTHGEWRG